MQNVSLIQSTKLVIAIALAFIAALITGCYDSFDKGDISPADDQSTLLNSISSERMSVQTIDGNSISATCYIIPNVGTGNKEIYWICVPENWNGELILYAHGYVSTYETIQIPAEAYEIAPLATSLGFAFATTSFSGNGLHIQQGIAEMIQLNAFVTSFLDGNYGAEPSYTYLTGGSQGGIITTLALERNPGLFNGALSLCGPCGNFEKQLNYYGDFRLVFDYFFPGVLPGDLNDIPVELIEQWDSKYVNKIIQAISSDPAKTQKLLSVTKAPYDPNDLNTIGETVINTLWYNVFTIVDARDVKINGVIFDNTVRKYWGTGSFWQDFLLNRRIPRLTITGTGTDPLNSFETSGLIADPLVMMHTTKDPIQLFWHQPLYRLKVLKAGRHPYFTAFPILRYGHCNFTDTELVTGLITLIVKVKGEELIAGTKLLAEAGEQQELILSVETY